MNAKSKKSSPPWTDPDDTPEVPDARVQQATLYNGAKAVRRGRPKAASPQEPIKKADKARLQSQLGTVSKADMQAVGDAIRVHHGLAKQRASKLQ